jgi:hypothetical protein
MNNNKLNNLINSHGQKLGFTPQIIKLNFDQFGGETETETIINLDSMLIHESENNNEYTNSLLETFINDSEKHEKHKKHKVNKKYFKVNYNK